MSTAAQSTRKARRARRARHAPPVLAPVPPAPRPFRWTRADTVSTLVIAVLAFFTRFVGLTSAVSSGTPVFDEKHYVPQAWDMVRSQVNPLIGGIESNPGYGLVVHPPLGKQLIAYGEMIFGYTPLGWRVMVALFGSLTVVFTMALARRISHSWQVATFAGVLAVFDGVLLVSSRFGMLDIFQVFFIVAAAWALARDHQQVRERFHHAWVNGLMGVSAFGPRLGFRWWRFTAGVLLGLALGVKWSGLYYIAFFGLMSVFLDLALRRRYGVRRYVTGTLVRDTLPALGSLVVVPALLYLWAWRAWFASETSVYRHAATDGTIAPDSWLNLLPDTVAGWLHYHLSVLEFHASLTTSAGHSHPWDSKPWSWLVGARPILYFSSTELECGAETCRRMIFLFGTPAIWWVTVPALLWGLWCLLIRRDRRFLIPLVAFTAGFLPWLVGYDRQMYFFYAAALAPFTICLIALALGQLTGAGRPVPRLWLRRLAGGPVPWGTLLVIVYLALVVAMFCYWSPILYGYMIPDSVYHSIMWLPSWT
ncbi:dolichyl-phosphate-mannose--protein O- mannosyl transferase [Corynebacterium halotolerans YIM 70093 = DSM 44683]|uniref:Polyprenol-phosphate-mannose--protein mannosyltransferase n=1 Tax=Corynebacterium halotolerans YIM 70093 = DSM 44683 TaxID=1121362 RepID=M1P5G2_9CORY|nr:dolichyl-phosphate-mannose--protein O- mannosyl transferase [Corynebacterium halotolerans YIM 70093 = DSM 44683]